MSTAVTSRQTSHAGRARELVPLIREYAAAAEAEGAVQPGVVEAFYRSGLHRLLVLPELDGEGSSAPSAYEAARILASGDSSTGWNFTFLMMGPVFGHYLSRHAYTEVFGRPRGNIVGTVAPSARAVPAPGGFVFSGKTSYNSAHVLATHATVGAMVMRDGQPSLRDGSPEMLIGVVPIEQLTILPTWNAAGMRATGSDDVELDGLFVPQEWTFSLGLPAPSWRDGAWAKIPLATLLSPAIASVVVGAARGCLDAFRGLATHKKPTMATARLADQPGAQIALAEAESLWLAADAVLAEGTRRLWTRGEADASITAEEMAASRLSCVAAARLSRRAAEIVADHAGMNAALMGNPIDRFIRDIRTMMQHTTLGPARLEVAGRVLMGLDAGTRSI